MEEREATAKASVLLRRSFWVLVFFWTVAIVGLLLWSIHRVREETETLASHVAETHFDKEKAFRLWVASQGGVYAPANEKNPPNPLLENIPDRDIQTSSGRVLTLMPGFHVIRQVREQFPELYRVKSFTTSLRPLRAGNAPDEWQKRALDAFARGEREVKEVTEIAKEPYLRMMRPHIAEKACLKCHGRTGFKEGDILGGVEVSLPLKPFLYLEHQEIKTLVLSYGAVFLIGLVGLLVGRRRLERVEAVRIAAQESLRESERRFMDVLYGSEDAILLISGNTFIDCNEATARMLGYASRQEFLRSHPSELSPCQQPDGQSSFEKANAMMRLAFERGFHRFEWIHSRSTGEDFPVEVSLTPIVREGKTLLYCVWRDITERKRAEESLRSKTHQLNARVKELNCLYSLSKLVEKSDLSLDRTLQGVVDLLPTSWQYSEFAGARLVLDGQEFKTENLAEAVSKQSADIIVHGEHVGFLEVGYLEEAPQSDEGPFLKEERSLIDTIAERVGRIVERKRAEETLEFERRQLLSMFESMNEIILVIDPRTYEILYPFRGIKQPS